MYEDKFLTTKDSSYTVNKPWGHEIWIARGTPKYPYVLKEIKIDSGFKSSLHYHVKKQETNLVLSGSGKLEYSVEKVDVEKLSRGEWSDEEMSKVLNSIEFIDLKKDSVFHMFPGMLHRVHAVTTLVMHECSSIEIDDVIRVQDDSGRSNGRIESEHRN